MDENLDEQHSDGIPYTPNGISESNEAFRTCSSLLLSFCGKPTQLTFSGQEDTPHAALEHQWTDVEVSTTYKLTKHHEAQESGDYEFHQLHVSCTYPDGQSSLIIYFLDDYNHSYSSLTCKQTKTMEEAQARRHQESEEAGLGSSVKAVDSHGNKLKAYILVGEPAPALQISMLTELVDKELQKQFLPD